MQAATNAVVRRKTRLEKTKNDLHFKNDPAKLIAKASVIEDRTDTGTSNQPLELSHEDCR